MTRRVVAALAVAALAVGCGKDDNKRIRRDKDAGAPVEAIDRGGRARTGGDEREPNGSDAEATALPLGQYARGSLDGETDVDVYRVTVPGTGQLRVVLSGIDDVDLALELRDGNGTVVARSDRGPARTVEGFPGFGVTKGEYLVAVKEFVKPRPKKKAAKKPAKGKKPAAVDAGVVAEGRVGPSQTYELTVELLAQPPDLHEIEPDDDAGTAVEVLLADVVRGWIGWSGDVDLWKLALEGVAPQYGLDLEVTGVDGLTLSVDILDAGGTKLLSRKGAKGGPVMIKSIVPALGDGAPPWHFVRVSADRSNPESTYELRFTTRLLELDEETEPNDDATRASALRGDAVATSGTMRASYAAGDVDRFLLDLLSEPTLVDVTAEPPVGVDVELEISLLDGAVLATASAGGAGAKERLSGVVVPAGKKAVITVKAKASKADTGEARPYRVIWSIVPASGDLPMPPEEMPPEETDPMPGEDDGAGPIADPE